MRGGKEREVGGGYIEKGEGRKGCKEKGQLRRGREWWYEGGRRRWGGEERY